MISLHEALSVVAASQDHRIQQRLPELPTDLIPGDVRRGLYVDVETTGLDTAVDEVIEFGGIPFLFSLDGLRIQAVAPLHFYNEPRKALSEEITKLTGISVDMVAGKIINVPAIEGVLESIDIVIAHNAAFDRPMLERVSPKFIDKHWGCSMSQVPWGSAKRLEYILGTMGYFYEAHNAVTDCQAGLFAISQPLGESTGLAYILEASRAKSYRVKAIESPFETKDALKARGYFWNGDARCWSKEIAAPEAKDLETLADEEERWLRANAYRGKPYRATFDRITAKERFTKRG